MNTPIELVPLRCPGCQTPVPAQPDEFAWACQQCGQGIMLHDVDGLEPITIHYAEGIPAGQPGKPFWVAEGTVRLNRDAYGAFGKRTREAEDFWELPRRFFVPAASLPLEELLSAAVHLLKHPLNLTSGPAAPFAPVTLAVEDVKTLAEFVVMAVEAERKDKVKKVQFTLQLGAPELWVLP